MHFCLVDTHVARFPYAKDKSLMLSFGIEKRGSCSQIQWEEQLIFLEKRLQVIVSKTLGHRYTSDINTIQGWPPHFVVKKSNRENVSDQEMQAILTLISSKLILW